MTMGDRIKTRQQLRDEQTEADAAHARPIPSDDRHNESVRLLPAHHSTEPHVNQNHADVQGSVDAARQELEQLRQRMAVIKQEVAVEVNRNWVSPWRTQDMFDLKVKTRLTSHQEYRSLQNRVRDAQARLPVESDAAMEAGTAR
jgi:hypothetical protein